MRVAILGAGNVGSALGKGWAERGHAIAYGVRNPADPKHRPVAQAAGGASVGSVAEAVRGADVIVLAVPYGAAGEALAACRDLSGRIVIDATNPLKMGPNGLELALGLTTSGGEHVASLATGASVFKAMNQIGFEGMAAARAFPVPPAMFVAGDDETRKATVMQLVSELGFDAVDAGGIAQSRLLEPLAMLWIHMTLNRKIGRDRAFAYVARKAG